jgi:hypothetical protein
MREQGFHPGGIWEGGYVAKGAWQFGCCTMRSKQSCLRRSHNVSSKDVRMPSKLEVQIHVERLLSMLVLGLCKFAHVQTLGMITILRG